MYNEELMFLPHHLRLVNLKKKVIILILEEDTCWSSRKSFFFHGAVWLDLEV